MSDGYLPCGVDYCMTHHGIRNEDASVCDFARDDEEPDEYGLPRSCVLHTLVFDPSAPVAMGAV